jgi:UDP-sugar pyrophosphorylase
MSQVSRATESGLTEDRLERLERLDRLDARNARDARDRREAAEAADARRVRLDGMDAAEAKDEEAAARALLGRLVDECGQAHLLSGWDEPFDATRALSADERRLLAQLRRLDRTVAGGLAGYIGRARTLLEDSRLGRNPLEGYAPSIPTGIALDFGGAEFSAFEAVGARAVSAGAVGFVLVAGGMGERLGFSGIKLALPAELATGTTYLQLYAAHILALSGDQTTKPDAKTKPEETRRPDLTAKPGSSAPLVIMTSDETDAPTRALLQEHDYFGLAPSRVHLLRQEGVPCLASPDARLALAPHDRYAVLTKPNGHGEVHRLLHSSGLAATLHREGISHLCFLQDTNGLVFHAIPAALGVSLSKGLALNFVSVHRKPGDASGALLTLTRASDGSRVLANVEYNQLEPLLRSTSGGENGDDADPDTGMSPYPGNCNQLVVDMEPYLEVLQVRGVIGWRLTPTLTCALPLKRTQSQPWLAHQVRTKYA